jgi:hypothetical protein
MRYRVYVGNGRYEVIGNFNTETAEEAIREFRKEYAEENGAQLIEDEGSGELIDII